MMCLTVDAPLALDARAVFVLVNDIRRLDTPVLVRQRRVRRRGVYVVGVVIAVTAAAPAQPIAHRYERQQQADEANPDKDRADCLNVDGGRTHRDAER